MDVVKVVQWFLIFSSILLVACSDSDDSDESMASGVTNNGTKNILFILADDLGVDNVSVYDEQPNYTAQTPTIDGLAAQGTLFRNVWSNPQCAPSRASLLTGRYAFRHGVTHAADPINILSTGEETLADALSAAGYQTALFGKWHLGEEEGYLPTDRGFDHYSGDLTVSITNYNSWTKNTMDAGEEPTVITEVGYATQVQAEETVEWINSKTTGPWFAEIAFNAPHAPFHIPPAGTYTSVTLEGSVGDGCPFGAGSQAASCYRAMIENMDYYIDYVLSNIDADKLANTVIVFMGDNGTPAQVIINEEGYPFSTTHGKPTVYEGGVNVPLIITGGSNTQVIVGEEDALIEVQDVFSTIMDVAGATSTAGVIDGQSLVGYLDSSVPEPEDKTIIYTELYHSTLLDGPIDRWAMTDGTDKYIHALGVDECYNLVTDPGEENPSSGSLAVCDELKSNRPQ